MNRLEWYYQHVVRYDLLVQYGLLNIYEVPRITHIVVHSSVGTRPLSVGTKKRAGLLDDKLIRLYTSLTMLTGQRYAITRCRASSAAFQTRKGDPLGCRIVLRGSGMFGFLDELVTVILPRLNGTRYEKSGFEGRRALNSMPTSLFKVSNSGDSKPTNRVIFEERRSEFFQARVDSRPNPRNFTERRTVFPHEQGHAQIIKIIKQGGIVNVKSEQGSKRRSKALRQRSFAINLGFHQILLWPYFDAHFEFFEECPGFQITIHVQAADLQQARGLCEALQIPCMS